MVTLQKVGRTLKRTLPIHSIGPTNRPETTRTMRARCCGVGLSPCAQTILAPVGDMTDWNIYDARSRARSIYTMPVPPVSGTVVSSAVCGLASERDGIGRSRRSADDPSPLGED